MTAFRKAVKEQLKARVALEGPTGAGKTWTALEWAGILADGGPVAVIDTEHRSASNYADRFDFDVLDWPPPYDPTKLANTIKAAARDYRVVVIDSLTHFWSGEGGTLDIVDAAAQRARGNTFVGWKTGTPALRHLMDVILAAPCHVIATMRSKMEYVLEDRKGKDGRVTQVPVKVGMAPEMRNGIEYEFTVVGELTAEHQLMVTKSRCHLIADLVAQPGRSGELAEVFRGWLDDGEQPTPPPTAAEPAQAPASKPAGPPTTVKETAEPLPDVPDEKPSGRMTSAQRFAVDLGLKDEDRHRLYRLATGSPPGAEVRYDDLDSKQRNQVTKWAHQYRNTPATLDDIEAVHQAATVQAS